MGERNDEGGEDREGENLVGNGYAGEGDHRHPGDSLLLGVTVRLIGLPLNGRTSDRAHDCGARSSRAPAQVTLPLQHGQLVRDT